MSRALTHFGPGPRYGRGRKRVVGMRWTSAQVAVTLGFLIAVVVIVIAGMYFGWLSAEEEEQTNSPETNVSAPLR